MRHLPDNVKPKSLISAMSCISRALDAKGDLSPKKASPKQSQSKQVTSKRVEVRKVAQQSPQASAKLNGHAKQQENIAASTVQAVSQNGHENSNNQGAALTLHGANGFGGLENGHTTSQFMQIPRVDPSASMDLNALVGELPVEVASIIRQQVAQIVNQQRENAALLQLFAVVGNAATMAKNLTR